MTFDAEATETPTPLFARMFAETVLPPRLAIVIPATENLSISRPLTVEFDATTLSPTVSAADP